MMDPDKELEMLEQEYPRSRKAWLRDTPTELDGRILSLAVNHAPYLQAVYQLKQEQTLLRPRVGKGKLAPPGGRPPKGIPPQRRADIAASQSASFESMASYSSRSVPPRKPSIPPGTQKLLAYLENAEQQVWLDSIANIVRAGDTESAIYLLRRYRRKFRDS